MFWNKKVENKIEETKTEDIEYTFGYLSCNKDDYEIYKNNMSLLNNTYQVFALGCYMFCSQERLFNKNKVYIKINGTKLYTDCFMCNHIGDVTSIHLLTDEEIYEECKYVKIPYKKNFYYLTDLEMFKDLRYNGIEQMDKYIQQEVKTLTSLGYLQEIAEYIVNKCNEKFDNAILYAEYGISKEESVFLLLKD